MDWQGVSLDDLQGSFCGIKRRTPKPTIQAHCHIYFLKRATSFLSREQATPSELLFLHFRTEKNVIQADLNL